MPAVKAEYLPNDVKWAKMIDELADAERLARNTAIEKRRLWYSGEHPDPLEPMSGKINDNVKYNLCGRGIDKENEFIGVPEMLEAPGGVTLEHSPTGQPERMTTPEQELADAYYARIKSQLPDIKLDGMVSGHVFLKLFSDYNDDDVLQSEFALIEPELVTMFWEMGRGSRARTLWYRLQWKVGDTPYRQDIVPEALITPVFDERGRVVLDFGRGWQIIEYESKPNSTRYTQTFADVWPYRFPPMLDWRNKARPHQQYGVPTLDNGLISLNHSVNFTASNVGRILYHHAHPKTIAPGIDPDLIKETAIDGLWSVPAGTQPYNLEMQSDLASSMNFLNEVKSQFFSQLRVLDTSSVKDRLGGITNFGVRMLFSDQMELTEDLRMTYGELACELAERLSEIDGTPLTGLTAKWVDPLPVNRLELVQTAAIEDASGFASKVTLQADLGRDPVTEAKRMEAQQQDDAELMTGILAKAGERGGFGTPPALNGNGNGRGEGA